MAVTSTGVLNAQSDLFDVFERRNAWHFQCLAPTAHPTGCVDDTPLARVTLDC